MKDHLLKHYTLRDSIKKYKGYKVKSPEETIKIIESYFSKIDLDVKYIPFTKSILRGYSPFQSGSATLSPKDNDDITLLKTNGKGVTSLLSQASATAGALLVTYGNLSHQMIKD